MNNTDVKIYYEFTVNELQIIELLNTNIWNQLYVQGGKIEDDRIDNEGFYKLSSLFIDCGKTIYVGGKNFEFEQGFEAFRLLVGENNMNSVEKDKKYYPEVKQLEKYSKNLELEYFLGTPLTVSVLKMINNEINISENKSTIISDSGLLIKNKHMNKKLLIIQDLNIPLNIKLTTSESLINKYIKSIKEIKIT